MFLAYAKNQHAADLFTKVSHTLGHLIHYADDEDLKNIVILKPDWLATAISFVFDDRQTRDNHGLVNFERLGKLWNDPTRDEEDRYPQDLHSAFVRLMERFDLSYRVVLPNESPDSPPTSLISQLVPDTRPDELPDWGDEPAAVDLQQKQICRIVDESRGRSATAEELFFQLISRLHKYSLGLTVLNAEDGLSGVYEISIPNKWLVGAASGSHEQ